MQIGILALQGGFQKHRNTLERLDIATKEVRLKEDLDGVDALILPGGESTTMIKLMFNFDLFDAMLDFANAKPIFGTCAGSIIMSQQASNFNFPTMKLLDIDVERNAYGTQVDSFHDHFNFMDENVESMFIRAPKIKRVGDSVTVLAIHDDLPIIVANDNHMVCTCHPELTDETALHAYFVEHFVKKNTVN